MTKVTHLDQFKQALLDQIDRLRAGVEAEEFQGLVWASVNEDGGVSNAYVTRPGEGVELLLLASADLAKSRIRRALEGE